MVYGENDFAFKLRQAFRSSEAGANRCRRRLLLSVAAAALLAAPILAKSTDADIDVDKDTICVSGASIHCITDKTTKVLQTSTATATDLANSTTSDGPSNVYVFYDSDNGYGEIVVDKANAAIVTIDSSNYVYSNGILSNTGNSGAVGLKVDMSKSPDLSSALKFENYEEDYITKTAIYLDSSSYIYLTGDGSGKTGIWLDTSSGSGTLTGDIITYNSSLISIKGDNSYGVRIDSGATVVGNIDLGGSIAIYQHTAKSKDYSGLYGLYMNGYIDGNVGISGGGSMLVAGSGAQGFFITGSGVGGNVTIAGTLETEGYSYSSTSSSSYYSSNTNKTYPEGGTALTINANVAKGVEITGLNFDDDSDSYTGSAVAYGTDQAVLISPVATVGSTTYTASSSVVIGLFQSYDSDTEEYTYEQYDPGFGFYNRGTISISPTNYNVSAAAALKIYGTSSLPTYIDGGLFNSGSISATATTDKKNKIVSSVALLLSGNVYIGGYYDTATGTYYKDSYTFSCTGTALSSCTYTYSSGIPTSLTDSDGNVIATEVTKSDDDNASLVNSGDTGTGTISASISGKGSGTATALYISSDARVTSLINSGTISATATTTKTDITDTLAAYAIQDMSGTLTYIRNSGKITASATTLDSDDQIAYAIDLSAPYTAIDANTALTDAEKLAAKKSLNSYSGVTIVSTAQSDGAASITGDIVLGDGYNQKIYVSGAGSSYSSSIVGDITYGTCDSSVCTTGDSGDLLSIGAFGYVTGSINAPSGVDIAIFNNGLLYITNDYDSCTDEGNCYVNANDITVADGGYFSLGLKLDSGLNEKGIIRATGDVYIEKNANLGVSFDSYLTSGNYTLIRSYGTMTIDDLATYTHDISTPIIADGTMPFLFKSASLTKVTGSDSTGAYTDLVLSVDMKSADDLKLTGYAKQMFETANLAIATDDDLGSAMINGVHANVDDLTATGASEEAQKAYDSFAPNVTGGTRAIAVAITDQATGVVGARQRSLRMYAKEEGELTLWAQQFVQQIKNPGQGAVQEDGSREKNGFKDHGFGVVLGMDAGNATDGWYGGALTFYNGDVNEIGRTSHENQLWFVATGYSTWRGKGLFLDTKVDLGYAHIKGLRFLHLKTGTGDSQTSYYRYAQNAHSAAMLSGGATAGAFYTYGSFTFMPQFSLDGLLLRENGYVEENPYDDNTDADGFNLKVRSHFAKSLRTFLGTSVRYDYDLDGYFLQPEVRLGYRYDFLGNPTRVKAAFKDLEPDVSGNQSGSWFTMTGPSAARGSYVFGTTLGLTSGAWSVNLNYDFVRGANNNIEQAATLNLIGRI